jgi:hypothetical protein
VHAALARNGEFGRAIEQQRAAHATFTQILGPSDNTTRICASNLANSELGQCDPAAYYAKNPTGVHNAGVRHQAPAGIRPASGSGSSAGSTRGANPAPAQPLGRGAFEVGTQVVVEALRSPAGQRHNGCTARVTAGLDPASGRCTVVLDASGEQIKVKPANIRGVRQRCRAL